MTVHIKLRIKRISFILIMLSYLSYSALQSQTEYMQLHNIYSELYFFLYKTIRANTSVCSSHSSHITEQNRFPHTRLQTTLINKYCKPIYVAIRK